MVTLSTFSCGHNVYVSAQSFKHYSCCFRTPLVRFLGPWPNFVYMFTCKFPAARCRPWLLLSDGFYTCSTMSRRGGGAMWGIRFVRMGRGGGEGGNGRISVGWHNADTQRSPTCWDPCLSLSVPGRNRNAQLSLQQHLDRWYCHSHIHVVRSRPRWPYTWRYTHSITSRPTMNTCTGRPNGECIATVADEHKLAQYSVVL